MVKCGGYLNPYCEKLGRRQRLIISVKMHQSNPNISKSLPTTLAKKGNLCVSKLWTKFFPPSCAFSCFQICLKINVQSTLFS